MSARNRIRQGFTLVEILIVVVILGILAAIVIPQFTSASETAKASNLASQLQTIRSQLELYQVQHNGEYPDLGTNWNQMTLKTADNHATGTTAGTHVYGPYLQKPPANPFITSVGDAHISVNQVGDRTGILAAPGYTAVGWAYSMDTGEIKANLPSSVVPADLGLDDTGDYNAE